MNHIRRIILLSLAIAPGSFADWVSSGATVIYVNGIGTSAPDPLKPNAPDAGKQAKLIADQLKDYLATTGRSAQTPQVKLSYNKTDGYYADFLQSVQQAVNVSDLGPYLQDLNNLTDPTIGPYPLFGTGAVFSSYTQEVVRLRAQGAPFVRPQDYNDLLAAIKQEISLNHQVILFGHSQGNFYTNYAYQEILADSAFQASVGITLPNPNILAIVGSANPASFSADTRYAYVTDCNDVILLVPSHLPTNIGSCRVLDLLTGPLTTAGAGQLATEYRALASPLDAWQTLLANPLLFGWSLFDSPHAIAYATRLLFAVNQHKIESGYLSIGTAQQATIMRLLGDSLPDPACGNDSNCYLTERFTLGDYQNNWRLTAGLSADVSEPAGTLHMISPQYPVGQNATTTLRTRRVFAGPFVANVSLTNLGPGRGSTLVSLKKASNDSTAISFGIDSANLPYWTPASGVYLYLDSSGLTGWQSIRFINDGSTISLLLGEIVLTTVPVDTASGYYLTVNCVADPNGLFRNTSEFRDVTVARPSNSGNPGSGRLKVTGSVVLTPAGTKYAGQIVTSDFTVQNVSGQNVTLDKLVLGGRLNGTNPCAGPCPDFSPVISGLSLVPGQSYKYHGTQQLAAGHYDFFVAYLPSGGNWVVNLPTAPGQVNSVSVDTVVPLIPNLQNFGVVSSAVAGSPFDGILLGTRFDQTAGNLQVWFCQVPNDNPCYRQPASLVSVSAGQAILTSINLAAGTWHAHARNTPYGTYSNFSNSFDVAPKPITPLSVTCTASPATINEGQSATFKAVPIGTSPFKFNWMGAVVGTSQSISKIFQVAGLYTAQVSVTDASGSPPQIASCTLQVNSVPPPPTAPLITSFNLPSTPVAGTNFDLGIIGTGFVTGSLQVWFFGTTTCLSGCRQPDARVNVSNSSSATVNNIQLGLDSYNIKVRNGDLGPWSAPAGPFQTISALTPNFSLLTLNASANVVAGQPGAFDITIASKNGFAGVVSWQVTGLPTGVSITNPVQQVNVSSSGATFTASLSSISTVAAGAYSLVLKGTSGSIFQSLSLTLNIAVPPISASCTVNGSSTPITVNTGVALNYAITPSGGRSPYHYSWIGVSGAGDISSISVTPSGLASIDVSAQVTDSSPMPLSTTANCPRVTINPPPQPLVVSCAPLQNPVTLGQQVQFEATISGGTQPYLYSWTGLYTGSTANALAIPTSSGTFNETLVLTDSGTPPQSKTANCSVTVNPSPDITVQGVTTSVTAQQGFVGGPFQVAVTPINGFTGIVSMNISGQPAGVTINPVSATISGPGTVYLSANVSAANNATLGTFSLSASVGFGINNKTVPLTLTITPAPLTVTCTITPNVMKLGDVGTLAAFASGGYGGYQYDLNGTGFGSSSTMAVFAITVGSMTKTVVVRDSQGNVTSNSCMATVQGVAPTITGFAPDTQPHNAQNFSATISGTGFVDTSTVLFFGPGCANGCQHPPAGVTVFGLNSIRVVNVRLGTGSYQVKVVTPYGSALSSSFSVLP